MTYSGIDNDIDDVLENLFKKQTEVYDSAIRERHNDDALIEHLQLSGLIKKYNPERASYILLPLGFEVIRSGGWKAYLAAKENEQILHKALIKSSIKTNSLQKVLLWLTVGFSVASFAISYLDYSVHSEELRLQQMNINGNLADGLSTEENSKTIEALKDSVEAATDSLAN